MVRCHVPRGAYPADPVRAKISRSGFRAILVALVVIDVAPVVRCVRFLVILVSPSVIGCRGLAAPWRGSASAAQFCVESVSSSATYVQRLVRLVMCSA